MPPALHRLAITFPHGELTMIAGAVGSGKSSLLCALLGELRPVADGGAPSATDSVRLEGAVGYFAQARAWLRTAPCPHASSAAPAPRHASLALTVSADAVHPQRDAARQHPPRRADGRGVVPAGPRRVRAAARPQDPARRRHDAGELSILPPASPTEPSSSQLPPAPKALCSPLLFLADRREGHQPERRAEGARRARARVLRARRHADPRRPALGRRRARGPPHLPRGAGAQGPARRHDAHPRHAPDAVPAAGGQGARPPHPHVRLASP
jgi:hypothetical protein